LLTIYGHRCASSTPLVGRRWPFVGIAEVSHATVHQDETGNVQVIDWKSLREKQRPEEVLRARLLSVYGTWQREGDAKSLIAGRLEDLTPMLGKLATSSRDFH